MEVLSDISTGHVKRISWASYGSKPDLWFFSYKTEHGAVPTYRIGKGAPEALLRFISELARLNLASIRVQFGNKSSFVAWSGTIWAASHDLAVRAGLKEMSSSCQETSGFTMGSLKHETLDNVQWHQDGSWYIKSNDRHIGKFQGAIMRRAWAGLWKGTAAKDLNSKLQGELAVSQASCCHAMTNMTSTLP
jgi:methylenetetrahydrofolate dehydrogenase (NADP+)/methenyltetrahydrofolate cyclohydrolase/formyltetrahydrofolate synthetase